MTEQSTVFVRCRVEGCGPFEVCAAQLPSSGYWDLDCPTGHTNPLRAETAPPSLRELYWESFEAEIAECDEEARSYLRAYTRRKFSLTA